MEATSASAKWILDRWSTGGVPSATNNYQAVTKHRRLLDPGSKDLTASHSSHFTILVVSLSEKPLSEPATNGALKLPALDCGFFLPSRRDGGKKRVQYSNG